jgi:UDP-N-acetylmuramate dehydrogenase
VTLAIADDVPLAPLTTLQLGGPARHLAVVTDEAELVQALAWARAHDQPVLVLGGGSNLVVGDRGFDGLVIRMANRGISFVNDGSVQRVWVAAGEPWDQVVAEAVERDLAGIECLSGIPGLAGATPIQNVGAYGQEVSDSIWAVRVLDRQTLNVSDLPPERCGFAYRDSLFKRQPDRWVVLGVTFHLLPGGAPVIRYRELEQALTGAGAGGTARRSQPTLAEVRETVLRLRRAKSMVIDPADVNRHSAGSFFMNPILPAGEVERLVERWRAAGLVAPAETVPQFAAPATGTAESARDRVKLSAAWLIERAGFSKGFRRGAVGISTRHALALVHHGGGTTAELLALADLVQGTVEQRLGVRLAREPVVVC